MKKYAVAVLSCFKNENTVQILEAENEKDAIIKALNEFSCRNKSANEREQIVEDNNEWLEGLETLDDIIQKLYDGEICVSIPVLIEDIKL